MKFRFVDIIYPIFSIRYKFNFEHLKIFNFVNKYFKLIFAFNKKTNKQHKTKIFKNNNNNFHFVLFNKILNSILNNKAS